MVLALLLLTLVATVTAGETSSQKEDAFVLASKSALSMFAVGDKEFVVTYSLYNAGEKAAIKVVLDDRHSFPTQTFEGVKGALNVRFESIAPGSHVTHTVVVKPRQTGEFNQTAATLTYYTEGERNLHVGYTNFPGPGYIYRLKEYERKFSSKYPYWICFGAIIGPTTLGSLYAFMKSKNMYEKLAKKQ